MHTSCAPSQTHRQGSTHESASLGGVVPSRVERRTTTSPGSAVFSAQVWVELVARLRLSHREADIVRGVFDDHKESAIAAKLQIAPSSVHTHIGRLHHKLAVTDRVQLLLRILQEYLTLTAAPKGRLPLNVAGRASVLSPSLGRNNRSW